MNNYVVHGWVAIIFRICFCSRKKANELLCWNTELSGGPTEFYLMNSLVMFVLFVVVVVDVDVLE